MSRLLRIKPMSMLTEEAREQANTTLKRSLGALNLVTLGIGAVIGAGIFTLTGQAAALRAGPAVALSFVLAGLTCAFAGLCYAEFASIIPIAGSAYTYGYATLGELVAWIIGWDLCLEYAFGASTVASGWAGYFNSLLQQFHIYIPPQLTATTGTPLVVLSRPMAAADVASARSERGRPAARHRLLQPDCGADRHGDHDDPRDRNQGIGQLQFAIVIIKLAIVGIFLDRRWLVPLPASRRWQARTGILSCRRLTGTATSVGAAFPQRRHPFSSPISALTRFRRQPRKRRIRSATCRSGFSDRWWSAPFFTFWFRWCSPAW